MTTSTTDTLPTTSRFTFAIVWQGMLLGFAAIAAGLLVCEWMWMR